MERRLIDANELMKSVGKIPQLRGITYGRMKKAVEETTTIDAVEVVRCKDCEHWKKYADHSPFIGTCKIAGYFVGENGYCVYGKRRESYGE